MVSIGFDPFSNLPSPDGLSLGYAPPRPAAQRSFDDHLERATRPRQSPTPPPADAPRKSDSSVDRPAAKNDRREGGRSADEPVAEVASEEPAPADDQRPEDPDHQAENPDALAAAMAAAQAKLAESNPDAEQTATGAGKSDAASQSQEQAIESKLQAPPAEIAARQLAPAEQTDAAPIASVTEQPSIPADPLLSAAVPLNSLEAETSAQTDLAGGDAVAGGALEASGEAHAKQREATPTATDPHRATAGASVNTIGSVPTGQQQAERAPAATPESHAAGADKKPVRSVRVDGEQTGEPPAPPLASIEEAIAAAVPEATVLSGGFRDERASDSVAGAHSQSQTDQSSANGNSSASAPPVQAATPHRPAATVAAPAHADASAGQGPAAEEVDRGRFVQRVARAFHVAGQRGGEVRLRLSPPELGSLQVEISVREGVMTARMTAENSTARSLLLDNLPDLRQRLAEQDIRIDRFDVELRDQSSGGQQQTADRQADWQPTPTRRAVTQAKAPLEQIAENAENRAGRQLAGQLNVVI